MPVAWDLPNMYPDPVSPFISSFRHACTTHPWFRAVYLFPRFSSKTNECDETWLAFGGQETTSTSE